MFFLKLGNAFFSYIYLVSLKSTLNCPKTLTGGIRVYLYGFLNEYNHLYNIPTTINNTKIWYEHYNHRFH